MAVHLESQIIAYPAPAEAVGNDDFTVRVRTSEGDWVSLFTYLVCVDMHDVREASMATFDFAGTVEVEVTSVRKTVASAVIRPLSKAIAHSTAGNTISFTIDRPCKLSIEINGDRFHNLHLFANALETDAPDPDSANVLYVEPGAYNAESLVISLHASVEDGARKDIVYFAPGLHRFEDGLFFIPSDKTVYVAGGAIVVGAFVCKHVENVAIRGRGIVYLRDIAKTTYWRTVQIDYSRNVLVEDIVSVDPPHYSIHLGQSDNVWIRNFKSFSTRGWCDGIDMMSCSNVHIEDVFLRTSDDCIAVYGSRGEFKGDTTNICVKDSILWADVAHPIMIGCHGDHEGEGDMLQNLSFSNIDILEHHEPQDGYWGCMAINAGDKNTVRNVTFSGIRIEQFEQGRLVDIRVFQNEKYNPYPGNRVENIRFEHISFNGSCGNPSVIAGFDDKRIVDGVHFRDFRINGTLIDGQEPGRFECNEYVRNVTFSAD